MSDSCNISCSTCTEECNDRTEPLDLRLKPQKDSHIGKVIGVVSGKGGVGKSLVTSMLAVAMERKGYRVGILDADVTGPSIPKAFGILGKAVGSDKGILPIPSEKGINIMSINLLLQHDTDPVVWRGPIIAGTVKQFWTDVVWGELDYLFIDMPPGTGDVPLTVFQSIPVDGIVIVTSPQDLVSMIVSKAVKMAEMMKVPVLGLVENMAWFQCPDCGSKHYLFGKTHVAQIADMHGLKLLASVPVDPAISLACDEGKVESVRGVWLDLLASQLEGKDEGAMKIAVAANGNQVSGHFGHCELFQLFETVEGKIVGKETLPNPGLKPGFLPNYLHEKGIDLIIAGGMGGGAVELFNEKDIEVVVGAVGDVRDVVERYLQGALPSTGSVCHEHAHHGECGH